MSRNFSLLAATLGLVSPRYRTLGQWVETYREIIEARPLSKKTKANRHSALTHLMASLGDRTISAIRPHEEAREESIPACTDGLPVSLHECRSLSERLYRAQGINTMVLLGHKHQAMTDIYNDDRGLSKGQWQTLSI